MHPPRYRLSPGPTHTCRGGDWQAVAWLCALLAAFAGAAGQAHAGATRCWIDHGALVAPAAFGDIAGDFIIDPATPVSQLHVTRALMAGLDQPSTRAPLKIAGARAPNVVMAVADLDNRTRDFDTGIVGVIGADVLTRFTLDVRFSPCRLMLVHASAGRLPGAVRLSVTRIGEQPVVSGAVSDGVVARQGLFLIGLGRWPSRISGSRLSRPPPPQAQPPIRVRALEVGGRLFEQVPAEADPDPASTGVIGLSVWSAWRLRLDLRDGWLDLSPPP